MGNSSSTGCDESLVKREYTYHFSIDTMKHKPEDVLIVKYLATLLHMERLRGASRGLFLWFVSNKHPYISCYKACINYNGDFYNVTIFLDSFLYYSIICPDGTTSGDGRLLESLLYFLIKDKSKYIRIKEEFTLDLHVQPPEQDTSLTFINDEHVVGLVNKAWDSVYNKLNDNQLCNMDTVVLWDSKDGILSLSGIITDKVTFMFKYSDSLRMIVSREENEICDLTNWYTLDVKEKEKCVYQLTKWINEINAFYINLHIWDHWILEKKEYDSYIQWSPKEVLEDIISLI